MESPEASTTAESVAHFFATQPRSNNGSSAHVNADTDSVVRSVRDADTAWAAPGMNSPGLHLEQAGYARQTRAEWLDGASRLVIRRAAGVAATWTKAYDLRPRFVTDDELHAIAVEGNDKLSGFTAHLQGTRVLNGGKGHTDPGVGYPDDVFLADVLELLGAPAGPHPSPAPVLHPVGELWTWRVQLAAGFTGKALDGRWGPHTADACVRGAQRAAGAGVDGKWGRHTSDALHALYAHAHPHGGTVRLAGVAALQRAIGLVGSDVTGYFDSKTVATLERVRSHVGGPSWR